MYVYFKNDLQDSIIFSGQLYTISWLFFATCLLAVKIGRYVFNKNPSYFLYDFMSEIREKVVIRIHAERAFTIDP